MARWRAGFGPALTAALAVLLAMAGHDIAFSVQALACLTAVVFAAALGGLGSGLLSAAIAVTALATSQFMARHVDMTALGALAVTGCAAALAVGALQRRLTQLAHRDLQRSNTGARLAAALDEITLGIVLLDADTRAQFINRAFRDYFALPDELADSRPPFVALMYHGRDQGIYDMPDDELSRYIGERTRQIRLGDAAPVDLKLRDGKVLRLVCAALPDGGRMLSYSPVTDLVRRGDDPARKDYYLSLRSGSAAGGGASQALRAAE
jgi:PAS domain-containing protein